MRPVRVLVHTDTDFAKSQGVQVLDLLRPGEVDFHLDETAVLFQSLLLIHLSLERK